MFSLNFFTHKHFAIKHDLHLLSSSDGNRMTQSSFLTLSLKSLSRIFSHSLFFENTLCALFLKDYFKNFISIDKLTEFDKEYDFISLNIKIIASINLNIFELQ